MTGRRETALSVALVAIFFAVRLALLVVREPFFDELFTLWLARRPPGAILPALLLDSGPPLYYFVARLPDIFALRVESLVFATAALALVLTRESLGPARYPAALLLALYPPAALFAVDARAYSLCALFVAAGVIALHERRPFVATLALLLAAYAHYYGVLFLPLLVLVRPWRRMVASLAIATAAFAPLLWLASRQPPEATRWMGEQSPLAALHVFAFAGHSVEALLLPAPAIVVVLSAIALLLAGARSAAFLPAVLLPVVLAIVFALAGRSIYFPMRFESVLAVPLALWLGTSLARWQRPVAIGLASALAIVGAGVLVRGAIDHASRPGDPYQAAAVRAAALPSDSRIVASGYLVLPMLVSGRAFASVPPEQATHPGWRASGDPRLALATLPSGAFVWAGERQSPETLLLSRSRRLVPLYLNEKAVVAAVDAER